MRRRVAWSAGKEDIDLSRELYHNCLEEKMKFFLELHECNSRSPQ